MPQPSFRVQRELLLALWKIQNSPDLTVEEAAWLSRYTAHLIAEFTALKSHPETPAVYERMAA